ncbi:hypothetical protein [Heyndrickxia coagulans]|nr:hypothetical protein [Heyndrickxia coagulans]
MLVEPFAVVLPELLDELLAVLDEPLVCELALVLPAPFELLAVPDD